MKRQELFIRRAGPQDLEPLRDLILQAMSVYALQSGMPQPPDALTESEAETRRHLTESHVLVAERDSALIGTVRLIAESDQTALFTRFAVLPHLRQTGVGQRLYAAAEKHLREHGFTQVKLHTALSNPGLVTFYQSRGFHLSEVSHDRGYPRGTFLKNLK